MSDSEEKHGYVMEKIKKLGYTKTLLFIFIIPFALLFKTILKNVQKKPFFLSVAVVCVLGWAWSILLSYKGWWNFPEEFIIGIKVLPFLPLEEFLIYPIGGAFSIFFYTLPTRHKKNAFSPALYWMFLVTVTAAFAALAIVKKDTKPMYLYSQFVLYNGLCFVLAPWVAKMVNIRGMLISVLGLSAIGFGWDYLAFQFDWWVYIAITGVKIIGIPVEDFNFYLLAPTAAISLYIGLCRWLKVSQTPPL